MAIIKTNDHFLIKRIEKLADGWNLYPVDNGEPIYISSQNYVGKMPPKFKFPWQKHNLKITWTGDFLTAATMDDVLLFQIPEEQYPEDIKKGLKWVENMVHQYDEDCKKEDEQIKASLPAYLASVPENHNLEDELSTIRIPLRAYLKLHLFIGQNTKDKAKRLNLMFILCKICERIYKRHIQETDKAYGFDLHCSFATLKFGPSLITGEKDVYPDYHQNVEHWITNADKEEFREAYLSYYEAKELLEKELPRPENSLLTKYLNYLVRHLLWLYAEDWNNLQTHMHRHGFSNRRLNTDEQDYQFGDLYKSMKLLQESNFILPEIFPQEKIGHFIERYNLV